MYLVRNAAFYGNVSAPQPLFWTGGDPIGQNIRKKRRIFVHTAQMVQNPLHFFRKNPSTEVITKWHKKFSL